MILTCPACATRYMAPGQALGPAGRKVRCQACSHVWHATGDEPLDLVAVVSTLDSDGGDALEADAPEPQPAELPKAYRQRVEHQRRVRQAAAQGVVWAGLAAGLVGLVAGAWLMRVEIVTLIPRAGAAYAMIGAPVNVTGLEFEAMAARPVAHAPDRVLVSGAIRNFSGREVSPPPVRLALLDERGDEVAAEIVAIDSAPVLPGGVQGFAVIIPDPAARGRGVGVDFAAPEVVRTARSDGPPPAIARPLPTPAVDEQPMRGALAPIDMAHTLDIGGAHALSPSTHEPG